MPEAEFWGSTPYMMRLHCDAAADRDRHRFRHDMFTAWHAAAFGRIKRLPTLQKALAQLDRGGNRRRQTAEEMLAIVKAINAAHGGKVVKGG